MRSGKALATLGINQVVILFVTMVTRQRLTPVTVRLLQLVSKQTCCTFTRNNFFSLKRRFCFFQVCGSRHITVKIAAQTFE